MLRGSSAARPLWASVSSSTRPATAPLARRALSTTAAPRYASVVSPDAKAEKVFEIEMPEGTFAGHLDCPLPSLTTTTTKSEMLELYTTMVAIRRIETASDALYKSRLIRGFCHLSTGQEAIAAGMEHAITRRDAIITAYRCHGFMYTRGSTPKEILAELMGRKDGCSKGKGGSMHMYNIPNNFYGGNGIVGAQIPLGAGIAFAQKYKGENTMTFALYGDGAANQGQAFEAYNMAKLWKLPVAFVCENNMYGMGTRQDRAAANTKFYTRCEYIPGIRVNGMDVLAVRDACAMAKKWTGEGNGPLLMEFVTYRYGGHSMSDPGTTYRSREEIQYMRTSNDPIRGIQKRCLESGIATEEEFKAIDVAVRKQVDAELEEAKASPEPDMAELFTDVYIKGKEVPQIRGCDPEEIAHFKV